ncbi:Protein fyv-10 [Dirofilaria immitis]
MSGSVSGHSTWCGDNSKDEENLKDPIEIMKRAKEFLEKQNKILLDPMTWTIPPPSSLPTFPSSSISIVPVTPVPNPLFIVQPNGLQANLQPSHVPLYSAAVASNAHSFLTSTSKNLADVSGLKLLVDNGIVSSDKTKVLQNIPAPINQTNFSYRFENPVQLNGSQQQFRNQANDIVNKTNEMPHLMKIPPPPLPTKFLNEYRNQKPKNYNDLADISKTKPTKLFLNPPFLYEKVTH